jgi:hypothetical protein
VVESLVKLLFANESIFLVALVTFLPKSLNRFMALLLPFKDVGWDVFSSVLDTAADALLGVANAVSPVALPLGVSDAP